MATQTLLLKWRVAIMKNKPSEKTVINRKIKLDYGNITHKECKCCKKLLPISKFGISKKDYTYRKVYYNSMCKSCKREYLRTLKQKHIEETDYITLKAEKAYKSMRARCVGNNRKPWYVGTTMCEEWLNDKQSFIKWYRDHYYEIEGYSTALDKDLFGGDLKHYSPETVCLLPQLFNTMLSNSKRHRLPDWKTGTNLPLGVYYHKATNKYYGKIQYCGADKPKRLSYHDTPEEAFEEYRLEKKKDIKRMADKYKTELPAYIYEALLRLEIKPY